MNTVTADSNNHISSFGYDASGTVCYDADFTPFGGERPYTYTCSQEYKFEGKERDAETGNDDFGARYYSNRFGRWLSADWSAVPVAVPYANLTNPQTLNLYSMVADDPESSADLDGHCYRSYECNDSTRENCVAQACHGEQPNENKDPTPHANLCPNGMCRITSGGAVNAIRVFEHLAGDAIKGALGDLAIGVGVIGAEIIIVVGELTIFTPSTSSTDTWPHAAKSKTDTTKADTAGGSPSAAKDRSTVQGRQDTLEGVEQAQKDTTKKGGYRISKGKSEQDLKHGLKQIVDGARDPED